MNSTELLNHLKDAYPDKAWTITGLPNGTAQAVVFDYHDIAIHDPFMSENTIEKQLDRYGLSDEDARLMRRHNRAFEREVSGAVPDLDLIYDRIVEATTRDPAADPVLLLDDLGLDLVQASDGLGSFRIEDDTGCSIRVTDGAGHAPKRMGNCLVTRYDKEGNALTAYQAK